MIIFIDTNTLGLLAKPKKSFDESDDESYQAQQWFYKLTSRGCYFVTSPLCDYEFRRGLLMPTGKSQEQAPGIKALNEIIENGEIDLVPVTEKHSALAAQMWIDAKSQGRSTSDPERIDIDVIIAAQCLILCEEYPGREVIIATTNIRHLSQYCKAANWQDISL